MSNRKTHPAWRVRAGSMWVQTEFIIMASITTEKKCYLCTYSIFVKCLDHWTITKKIPDVKK